MTKVKICGLTRANDAELAIELGADYLGFIFVKESPRYVTPVECGSIAAALKAAAAPPHSKVGVFRNASREAILRTIVVAQLDMVQIHGEPFDVGVPVIHAFKVGDTLPDTTTNADYVLFDTGGGTGRTFDWSLLERYPRTKPFFLAGGITPDNAADAIAATKPYAIDLASGVERAPGIKDHDKLRKLFEAIRR
jgi:phosphoribosylanthranilate isomerase